MAISISFYKFAKKLNSTKRPDAEGITYDYCLLKDGCGVINPLIKVQTSANVTIYNYCYIPIFDRYYFVNEWFYEDALWNAKLDCDMLASWKNTIGSSELYVLRSASQFDTSIKDSLYPCKIGVDYQYTQHQLENWVGLATTLLGTYIVGIINNEQSSYGSITYYALTGVQMAEFRSYMLSDIKAWDDISDFTGDIAKAFIDPFQYVVSTLWFPIALPDSELGEDINLKFGFWDSGLKGHSLLGMTYEDTFHLERPGRNDTEGARGNWLYLYPFGEYKLILYPYGIIPIDGNNITDSGIDVSITVDLVTGMSICEVSASTYESVIAERGKMLTSISGQVGVPMQLSQVTTNYSAFASALPAIGGIISGNPSGIMLGASNAISSIADALQPKTGVTGQSGGISGAIKGNLALFVAEYRTPTEDDNEENGKPLCKKVVINTLSGYIVVAHGDVDLPATDAEIDRVKELLESGFYYE